MSDTTRLPTLEGYARLERIESLEISGFRGIGQLTIPRIGRVALIAGKNGVGKTTVLDAVSLYAARGRLDALRTVLMRRGELTSYRDEDGDQVDVPALDRLFHRNGDANAVIEIGPVHGRQLRIWRIQDADALESVPDKLLDQIAEYAVDTEELNVLSVTFDDTQFYYPNSPRLADRPTGLLHRLLRGQNAQSPAPVLCESLGPGVPTNWRLARLLDEVALTDDESLALEALQIVFGNRVERIGAIGEDRGIRGRRVIVKLSDQVSPVPLTSLGDGATRMFGISLALANYRNGILLIDEAENGIHYSVQSKFWNMVLCAAEMHNVQVLATTHSKDCINGFAAAALANPNVEGNLFRIGWHHGTLRAVDYSKEELKTAAEQNIEVR